MIVGSRRPASLPPKWRRAGMRVGKPVVTWIVHGGPKEVTVEKLSEDKMQVPIAVIWNHELLVQRIAVGWRPSFETGAQ